MRPHLLDTLKDRVLLCDGGTGSRVQAMTLDVERDYWGKENCTEVLVLSRPDLVRSIARSYLEAGSDVVQTNTFGGSPITLDEFDLGDKAHEINKLAVEYAREEAETFAKKDGNPRFVLGSIGPGTKLPTLGHIGYQALEDALFVQARGLVDGGCDGILIETCQDPLQIKAAINGAKRARLEYGRDVPLMVQVTIETTGTLLVGADIAAAATVINAMDVHSIGLNCATGPQEMAEHVKWVAENWPGMITVQPNAGLPELVDGKTHYPLAPDAMAKWIERFVAEDGINMVGGCCGTDIGHIAALDAMLRRSRRWRSPSSGTQGAQVGLGSLRRLALSSGAAAPGELVFLDRRTLQRQRLARVAQVPGRRQLGRLPRHGARAGARRLERARRLHRLRRPRRSEGDGRSHQPLPRFGDGAARRRFDRAHRSGKRPEALWRQGDPQLDQFRGRGRAGGQAHGTGAPFRHRRHRADDRRDRHGEGCRDQARHRQAPARLRLRPLRPARIRPDDRSADLHRRDGQRGRPASGGGNARRHRGDRARTAGLPDRAGPLERVVRPQPAGAPRAEFGLP